MKLPYLLGLVLVLSACAFPAPQVDSKNSRPVHRMVEEATYAVDDSARGVTCYLSTRRYEAISCVKTFTPDSTR